jgi:hypothetical protein
LLEDLCRRSKRKISDLDCEEAAQFSFLKSADNRSIYCLDLY